MDYAEATCFEGYHFHHIGVWEEHMRLQAKRRMAVASFGGRG